MKDLELNNYGVQEMNVMELLKSNGGNAPVASYLTSDQIEAAGEAIRTAAGFVVGFISGFFG